MFIIVASQMYEGGYPVRVESRSLAAAKAWVLAADPGMDDRFTIMEVVDGKPSTVLTWELKHLDDAPEGVDPFRSEWRA